MVARYYDRVLASALDPFGAMALQSISIESRVCGCWGVLQGLGEHWIFVNFDCLGCVFVAFISGKQGATTQHKSVFPSKAFFVFILCLLKVVYCSFMTASMTASMLQGLWG